MRPKLPRVGRPTFWSCTDHLTLAGEHGQRAWHAAHCQRRGGDHLAIAEADQPRSLDCHLANPQLLVCDEVTSALDVSVQAAIIDVLADLQRQLDIGLLFVTHNLALIRTLSQEVAVMSEGRIVERGLVDSVLDDPQADYTKKLLSDTPSLEAALAAAG